MVHLGVGAFARALPLWLTEQVNRTGTCAPWGVAGFTGRSPRVAQSLARQQGLYHLLVRSSERDAVDRVTCLSKIYDGARTEVLAETLARPEVTVVTVTASEAGYTMTPDGTLDFADPTVARDLDTLRRLSTLEDARLRRLLPDIRVTTMVGRLLVGCAVRRRRADSAPMTVVPFDNVPRNGPVLRALLEEGARLSDPTTAAWITEQVDVLDTVVDRITPATRSEDRGAVEAITGHVDEEVVVTEPYWSLVIAGSLRQAPGWQQQGALVVDEVEPFAQRKLRMLNGAHSFLAHAGLLRGHRTVDEAIADPGLRGGVQHWWAEAAADLPATLDPDGYGDDLLTRFANVRLPHRLEQIAQDGQTKVSLRVLPVLRARRCAGEPAPAAQRIIAACLAHLSGSDEADARQRWRTMAPDLVDDADLTEDLMAASAAIAREAV